MNITPAIAKRITIAKGVGFLFGLAGLISLPYFWPDADWMIRWGILLWYTTLGGIVGIRPGIRSPKWICSGGYWCPFWALG